MTRFSTPDAFYNAFGTFVRRITESRGFGGAISDMSTPVQLEFTDPEATIVVRPYASSLQVSFGQPDPSIVAVMTLSTETAHQLMLGEQSFRGAVDRGDLVFTPEIRKFLALVPSLSFAVFPRYRDHLRSLGRQELL